MRKTALLLLPCLGCVAPPEAPEALDELSRFLYREWDHPDPLVMEDGIANLEAFLSDFDMTGHVNGRSWEIQPLFDEDVLDISRPDRPLEDCVALGVAVESRWPVFDHARVQAEADQTPFEPTAPEHYDRFFLDPEDSACLPGRECDVLRTLNEATRKNFLLQVTFDLFKDFRWVRMPGEEDRWALVARSWFAEPWPGAKENVTLWQSYAVDVWMGVGEDTTWRFQALWSESDLGFSVSDKDVIATVKLATDNIFGAGDDAIGEQYHDE